MRDLADRWLSTVLALIGTVAVVLVFLALLGEGGGGPGSAVTTRRASATPSSASASPSPSQTRSASGSPAPGGPGSTAPSALRAPVIVLNQAGVKGLAGRTARELEAGGWTVTGTGDFSGTVPSNTVYFPTGMERQAMALTRQFPQITSRTNELFPGLRGDRLTLILATDWRR